MDIKERITTTALDLFFRFGVRSITMDDVAKHLSISKKTIYQYFKDKDDLVASATDFHMQKEEAILREIADNAIDPVDEVLKISEHLKQVLEGVNPSLLFDIQKFHPKAWKKFQEHKANCIISSLVSNMKKGIDKGLYRSDIDVEIMSILRMEEIQMPFNPTIFPASRFKVEKVQIQFIEHFLYGICTLKGHKLINKYKHIQEED
jgi:AcrR family transcriptional regulator